MKNNSIILICLIVYLCSQVVTCKAQKLDNHINIYAEYVTGIPHGKELIEEKNFIYPSLYNNMNNVDGMSLKVLYKNHPYISWGMAMTLLKASNWKYKDRLDFQGSTIGMQSISPVIQFHNQYSGSNFINRVNSFLEIAPLVGLSNVTLCDSVFQIKSLNDPIIPPKNSHDLFFGVKTSIGLEWSITQSVGLVFSYSLQYNWIKSILYNEKQFTGSQLNLGIILKLKKDKHFFYQ